MVDDRNQRHRRYEPPQALMLGRPVTARGQTDCTTGSAATSNCITGGLAMVSCSGGGGYQVLGGCSDGNWPELDDCYEGTGAT